VAETIVVAKPGYVAPEIRGGFSGTIASPPDTDRRVPITVAIPGIGMNAEVTPEGIVDGRMTLPGDVHDVGWLQNSAGVGDKIGTAVIGGHVSDRHDNPGAMFHLNRARAGQLITVTRGGKRYQFKVVSTATFDRRDKLPHRYFTTTGRHRLALVSCTAKVVFPNGHFHYTRYLVILAIQVHR
jgi:trimeric autotransporter adhesin